MELIKTIGELKMWRKSVNSGGGPMGLVPTMGALHRGHAHLLRKSRERCKTSVLSIFINPTQFGPTEDLSKYPRTLEQDLEIAKQEGVDIVFAPSPDELYPKLYSTFVEESSFTQGLCGSFRPGHFRGVTTIVLKLFNLIRPDMAFFGLKDAQQFLVLDKMTKDLDLDLALFGVSTVREEDGLAYSSRNIYLSGEERKIASQLFKVLSEDEKWLRKKILEFETGLTKDLSPIKARLEASQKQLLQSGFTPQYYELRNIEEWAPGRGSKPDLSHRSPWLLASACFLGKTRLIDNTFLFSERLQNLNIWTLD